VKTVDETIVKRFFQSDIKADIRTESRVFAPVIAWADEHPVVWKIVTSRRSKTFGVGSCEFSGWAQRSAESDTILERVRHIHDVVCATRPCDALDPVFAWRAKFTLEHYEEKGFTGGFFQQYDANYPRNCMMLDYTPETFKAVLDRFCCWMDSSYKTTHVTVNGKIVRTFGDSLSVET